MSKRAEEAAIKAYPIGTRDNDGIVNDIGHPQWIRDYFIEGYEQAEKDLALTWEDIGFVHSCLEDIFKEIAKRQHDEWTVQDIYKEALRRFNEQRKK